MMKALKKKRKGGFTLIELIVVIAILGILAAIAVPRLLGFTDKAKATADNQVAAQVKNAVALSIANRDIVVPADLAAPNTTANELDIVTFTVTAATKGTAVVTYVSNAFDTKAGVAVANTAVASLIQGMITDIQLQTAGASILVTVDGAGAVSAVLQ